jgi:hypothetical protein
MGEPKRAIPDARREPTDIGEGFIWAAVGTCLGTLIFCAGVVIGLYPKSLSDVRLRLPLPVYPAPRLQPNPAADMRVFYAEEMRRLNGTGWVDQAHGIVHIPIDEAMREVAQEGIAGWPAAQPDARHSAPARPGKPP